MVVLCSFSHSSWSSMFSGSCECSNNARLILLAAVIPSVIAGIVIIACIALLIYVKNLRSQLAQLLYRSASAEDTTADSRPAADSHEPYESLAPSTYHSMSPVDADEASYTALEAAVADAGADAADDTV